MQSNIKMPNTTHQLNSRHDFGMLTTPLNFNQLQILQQLSPTNLSANTKIEKLQSLLSPQHPLTSKTKKTSNEILQGLQAFTNT